MEENTEGRQLVGNYYTNDAGDLYMYDKDGEINPVLEGACLVADSMSHLEGSTEWRSHYIHNDYDGNTHHTSVSIEDLHTSPRTVVRTFLSHGLRLVPGMTKFFIIFLLNYLPSKRMLRVLKSGWLENRWIYVQNQWVAGDIDETVYFKPEKNSPSIASMYTSGTLKQWKKFVATPLAGNPMAMFCLLFAFVGPLLKVIGLEGGGFCLFGGSSVGKTTGEQISSSVYGNGASPANDPERAYVQTWNLTSNAIEGVAAAHSDSLIVLDDTSLYSGADIGSDLYQLAGGRGKSAMDSHRRLKEVSSWRGSVLSTGEEPMLETIQRKGGRAKAGMLVRMIDIPVSNMLPSPPDGMSSSEFSNSLKDACSKYFGTPARAYITFLVDNLKEYEKETISNFRDTFDQFTKEMTPSVVTPLQERGIRRFAAVRLAGHAAVEAGVLPYSTDDIDSCVAEVMDTWLKYRPTVTDVQRSIVVLQDFLVRNGSSLPSFQESHVANPKGFHDGVKGIYAFTDAQLGAATGAMNNEEIAKGLRTLGFLYCNEQNRLKSKLKIAGGGESRFYAVRKSLLSADLHQSDFDDSVKIADGRN